jgi:hypothetical protein
MSWINTVDYTPTELTLFGLGCVLWAVAYGGVIRGIVRNKFVEIPAVAVMANIAWEFVWSWVYQVNIGKLFVYGYRAWFFLDLFINYGLFRYGHKQVQNPVLRRWFKPLYVLGTLSWVVSLYYFVAEGYDTKTGATSAFVLTVIMGFMYVVLFLQQDPALFSGLVGWTSFLGNALFAWFALLAWPQLHFLAALVWMTLFWNAAYVVIFHYRRRAAATAGEAVPAAQAA